MKRVFDLSMALIGIIVTGPVVLAVAMLTYISLGSPVLFRQERPGYKGRPFRIYKFRTMSDDRDARGNLLPDEQRLRGVGRLVRKLSLDELPQLFNVLKGDLSLVGPRPLLMEYLPLYSPEQMRRHDVKPGITGWAQVNGRNAIGWVEKFKLDVWYVDNYSFALDLKILWLTVRKVLKAEGISQDGCATVEKFRGDC